MRVSSKGIALIKEFEGCYLKAYRDAVGVWTIGYGITNDDRAITGTTIKEGLAITQAQADKWLEDALKIFYAPKVTKYDSTYHWNQNEFDALVSFAYNIGSIDKLTANGTRNIAQISAAFPSYNHAGGKVLNGLTRRRLAEKELFDTPVDNERSESMPVTIGSARIDENGRVNGGAAGDQTGNEVSTQPWYIHSKGWVLIRAKDAEKREKIAQNMESACKNNHIGYDQYQRDSATNEARKFGYDASRITRDVETDCSALVRLCVLYAGITVQDFNTESELAALSSTGEFNVFFDAAYTSKSDYLLRGDILVTKKKGHTVVVLSDGEKADVQKRTQPNTDDGNGTQLGGKNLDAVAREVINGDWGTGEARRLKLAAAGYDYTLVQRKVNAYLMGEEPVKENPYIMPGVCVTSRKNAIAQDVMAYVSTGEGVKWVQYELCFASKVYDKILDDAGGIDGICGEATVAVIKMYQRDKGLSPDGVCGEKTRAAMLGK